MIETNKSAAIETPEGDSQQLGQELINLTYVKAQELGRSIAKMLRSKKSAERALGERLLDNLKQSAGLKGHDDPAEVVRVACVHDPARAAEAIFRTSMTFIMDTRSHEPKKRHAATAQQTV